MKALKLLTAAGVLTITALASSCACHGIKDPTIRRANAAILPSAFPVYVKNDVRVDHPVHGSIMKMLPTRNAYGYSPGCYVTCYSRDKEGSIYSVGHGMYVKGQIRVNGLYIGRICQPQGYFFKDISAAPSFKKLCSKFISACKGGKCWAGGDTGGWFGIQ